jgi:uncharacterized Zn-binding protein involved in type VI secretion
MLRVVREGDRNSAGGRVVKGNPNFLVDNRPVSVDGCPVSPHRPCPEDSKHCHAKTANGTPTFLVDNIPVNVIGSIDTCGHPRVEGSPTFIIGRK